MASVLFRDMTSTMMNGPDRSPLPLSARKCGGFRNLQPGIHVYSFCQNHCCFSKIVTLLSKLTLFYKNHMYSHEDPRISLAPPK